MNFPEQRLPKEKPQPRLIDIPSKTFPPELQQTYILKAKVRPVSDATTAFLLVHGASEPSSPLPNPIQAFDPFLETLSEGNIASLIFHSRGVGLEKDGLKSDGRYPDISINQRVTDTINALFQLENELPDTKSIVIGGISMGGHVMVQAVEKLKQLADIENPDHEKAQTVLSKIKGLAFFGAAAYMERAEDLPAGNPKQDAENPDSRTAVLRETLFHPELLLTSPVFSILEHGLSQFPLFAAFGGKDDIIPRVVQDKFMSEVFAHSRENGLRYWYPEAKLTDMEHGLLSSGAAKTPAQKAEQNALIQGVIGFIQEVSG